MAVKPWATTSLRVMLMCYGVDTRCIDCQVDFLNITQGVIEVDIDTLAPPIMFIDSRDSIPEFDHTEDP